MIVRGTIDNLNDLIDLFDQYRIFYKKESDREGAKHFLSARILHNESVIFVYYDNNKSVGFTQLYPKYSSGMMVQNWILNDLYVDGEYRKSGVGTALINTAVEFALSKGAHFLQLETQVDNAIAQRLYRELGFQLQEPSKEFLLFKKIL